MAEDNEEKVVAVIYGRYSSGSSQTDQSLEGQLRDCYTYARNHGITVIQEYLDRHISGKDAENRQAFQRMIADSKKRKFSVILVWKLDRFSRNRYDSARYKAALKRNNVKVISVMEPIADGPEGIILESILEGFAEYYSAELSQKVKRGMLESAHKCKCVSRPPMGYKIGPERSFVIDEEKAPFIQKVFQMYVQGEPHQKIADEVNALGCRTTMGNPLGHSNIAKIIQCEKYVGVYESQGIRVEDAIPPIVSKELWHAAQERLRATANGSYTFKNHGASAKQNYLLSGKVFCGECGAPMIGETTVRTCQDGTKQRRSYYTCNKRKCNSPAARQTPKSLRCKKSLVRKEELETLVKLRTRFFLKQPEVLKVIHAQCQKIEANQQSRRAEVRTIKSQLKSVDKKIDHLLAAIEEGVYAPSVSQRLKDLEAQQFQLKKKLEQRDAPPKMSEQMKWFLSVYVPSDADTDEYWKDIFTLFLDSVVCFNNGKVIITFNLFDDDPTWHSNMYNVDKQVECLIRAEYTDYRVSNNEVHEPPDENPEVFCLREGRRSEWALENAQWRMHNAQLSPEAYKGSEGTVCLARSMLRAAGSGQRARRRALGSMCCETARQPRKFRFFMRRFFVSFHTEMARQTNRCCKKVKFLLDSGQGLWYDANKGTKCCSYILP